MSQKECAFREKSIYEALFVLLYLSGYILGILSTGIFYEQRNFVIIDTNVNKTVVITF